MEILTDIFPFDQRLIIPISDFDPKPVNGQSGGPRNRFGLIIGNEERDGLRFGHNSR